MNTISAVTPAQVQNITPVNIKKQNNVNFTGNLGDKFVHQIVNGTDVKAKDILAEAKGTFGLKSEKVEDIMESFVDSLKEFFADKTYFRRCLDEAERKIQDFPQEKQNAVDETVTRLQQSFSQTISAKNQEIAAKDKEVAQMKAEVAKYEPMVKVKSVEELDTIMPDKVSEILDELAEHKIEARKSMFDFLMTGKGQEDALTQVERNNQIMKARQDGMFNIPELDKKWNSIIRQEQIWPSGDIHFTLNMIENALTGHPNGVYLSSPVIKAQVKNNAMAILTPMANGSKSNLENIEKQLTERLNNVEKFHKGFAAGIEKYKKHHPNIKIEVSRVDFDTSNSKIKLSNEDGLLSEVNFYQVSNHGNSNWN